MASTSTRADAVRSRRLLMEAGADAFAEHGIDVQVSEITRRAGLAKGTFFRHFPTKRALLVAILVERLQVETAVARTLVAEPTDDMIQRFMVASAASIAPIRGVIETAILHGVKDGTIAAALAELIQALGELLSQAKLRDEVRDDVTAIDLHVLLLAATNMSAHFVFRETPELWRRYLAITLDGLHPSAASPLPVEAPNLNFPSHEPLTGSPDLPASPEQD